MTRETSRKTERRVGFPRINWIAGLAAPGVCLVTVVLFGDDLLERYYGFRRVVVNDAE